MSLYKARLPEMFPYYVEVPYRQLARITTFLNYPEPPATNGSSYAVTSDAPPRYRGLWLSRASVERLLNTKDVQLQGVRAWLRVVYHETALEVKEKMDGTDGQV